MLMQVTDYLPYSPPDCMKQMVTALPNDKVKDTLYHVISDWRRKKMAKQRYSHLDRSIQEMSSFFETRIEI